MTTPVDDNWIADHEAICAKATEGLECPTLADTIRVWTLDFANGAVKRQSIGDPLAAESARLSPRKNGDDQIQKRLANSTGSPTVANESEIPVTTPEGRESNGSTIQSTTESSTRPALCGWRQEVLLVQNSDLSVIESEPSAFTAAHLSNVDALPAILGASITSYLGSVAASTGSPTLSFAVHVATPSSLIADLSARTALPLALAELRRLRERTPRTADGMLVPPGTDVFELRWGKRITKVHITGYDRGDDGNWTAFFRTGFSMIWDWGRVFSTEEAAKAALAAREKGE